MEIKMFQKIFKVVEHIEGRDEILGLYEILASAYKAAFNNSAIVIPVTLLNYQDVEYVRVSDVPIIVSGTFDPPCCHASIHFKLT